MAYVLAPNQTVQAFPYTISDLKRDNPNVSFPRNPSDSTLANWNVFRVVDRPQPSFDGATQDCNQIDPTFENGEWVTTWQVTNVDADEIARRSANESHIVRLERNELLTDCDWTQLSDSPLDTDTKATWVTYRQQLRDIPDQTGFPWNVIWPTPPS